MRVFFWKEKLHRTRADMKIQKWENRKTVYLCELMDFSNVCPKGGLIVKREQKTHERKKTKGERKGSQTTTQHVPLRKTARHGERQAVGQKQFSVPVQTVRLSAALPECKRFCLWVPSRRQPPSQLIISSFINYRISRPS